MLSKMKYIPRLLSHKTKQLTASFSATTSKTKISLVLVQFLVYNPKQSHQQYNRSFFSTKILFLLPCCQNVAAAVVITKYIE